MSTFYLPPKSIQDALLLAGAVRDYDQAAVIRILDRADLPALAVTLASMVDIDRSPTELLAWNDRIKAEVDADGLRPHGTHAAFNRHKLRGERPCSACMEGERAYQRTRSRRPVSA